MRNRFDWRTFILTFIEDELSNEAILAALLPIGIGLLIGIAIVVVVMLTGR
jgi:hypothetical protein